MRLYEEYDEYEYPTEWGDVDYFHQPTETGVQIEQQDSVTPGEIWEFAEKWGTIDWQNNKTYVYFPEKKKSWLLTKQRLVLLAKLGWISQLRSE